jgi:hypothetical protein
MPMSRSSKLLPDGTEFVLYDDDIEILSEQSYDIISIKLEHLEAWINALTELRNDLS